MKRCNKCTNKVDLQKRRVKTGFKRVEFGGKMKCEQIEYDSENE